MVDERMDQYKSILDSIDKTSSLSELQPGTITVCLSPVKKAKTDQEKEIRSK